MPTQYFWWWTRREISSRGVLLRLVADWVKSVMLAMVQPPSLETVLLWSNMLVKASPTKGWMVVPLSEEKLVSSDTTSILALTKRSSRWKKVPQYIEQSPVNRINIWMYTRQTLNMNLSRRQKTLSSGAVSVADSEPLASAAVAPGLASATAPTFSALNSSFHAAVPSSSNCCTSSDSSKGSADSVSIIALASAYIIQFKPFTYVIQLQAPYSPIRFS